MRDTRTTSDKKIEIFLEIFFERDVSRFIVPHLGRLDGSGQATFPCAAEENVYLSTSSPRPYQNVTGVQDRADSRKGRDVTQLSIRQNPPKKHKDNTPQRRYP